MYVYELPDKDFKMPIIETLNYLSKMLQEQNEYFNKEIENTLKNTTQILELKNTITEI